MIRSFLNVHPKYDASNFIAETASVIGDVTLGKGASIWFNATVRGDVNRIRIGVGSNIQDNVVVHVTNRVAPTTVGDYVTVGHSAILHGCTVESNVLIGMGAVVLDHAVIGSNSIIGAKALVTQRVEIPPRSLVLGSPARVVRLLTDDEVEQIRQYADHYLAYSAMYRGEHLPDENPFYD